MHSQGREPENLSAPQRFYRLGGSVVGSLMEFAFKDAAKDDGLDRVRALVKVLNQHYQTLEKAFPSAADGNLSLSSQPRSRKKFNWIDEQFKEQDEAQYHAVSLPAMLALIQFFDCFIKIKKAVEDNTKIILDESARGEFKRAQNFLANRMKVIRCDVLPGFSAYKLYGDYAQAGPIIQKEFINANVQRLQEILGIVTTPLSQQSKPSAAGHFSKGRYSQRKSVHESVIRKRDSAIFSI